MDEMRRDADAEAFARNIEQLARYESDLAEANASLSGARSRERAVKMLIGGFGLLVGVGAACLSPIWGIASGSVVMLVAWTYRSSEFDDLAISIEVCERRVNELQAALKGSL